MDMECPVCLEPLMGTLVELGCCRKRVHIQCYMTKCPMCRADLPMPIHAQETRHVIVPVPVWPVQPPPSACRKAFTTIIFLVAISSGLITALSIKK